MARAGADKTADTRTRRGAACLPERAQGGCIRCGGFLVRDGSLSLFNCTANRCVQCGDVVDAVILSHRLLKHDSGSVRPQPAWGRRLG